MLEGGKMGKRTCVHLHRKVNPLRRRLRVLGVKPKGQGRARQVARTRIGFLRLPLSASPVTSPTLLLHRGVIAVHPISAIVSFGGCRVMKSFERHPGSSNELWSCLTHAYASHRHYLVQHGKLEQIQACLSTMFRWFFSSHASSG